MTLSLYNGAATYDSTTNVYQVSTSISTPDLNALLKAAPAGATVKFDEGTFNLTQAVLVTHGNITLEGAGEGKTIFQSAMTQAQSTMVFMGGFGSSSGVTSGIEKGQTYIEVADISSSLISTVAFGYPLLASISRRTRVAARALTGS